MIDLVKRVAVITGKDSLDLLAEWNQEVERALKLNGDRYDSRSFTIAAQSFLERHGVTMKSSAVAAVVKAQGKKA